MATAAARGLLVCRGGSCTAERFAKGSGVSIDADGKLRGVSVNLGTNLVALTATIPNRRVGVATLATIEASGGIVTRSPTLNNAHDRLLSGITAHQAQAMFTPTILNPNFP
jgi:hypothetical protein